MKVLRLMVHNLYIPEHFQPYVCAEIPTNNFIIFLIDNKNNLIRFK